MLTFCQIICTEFFLVTILCLMFGLTLCLSCRYLPLKWGVQLVSELNQYFLWKYFSSFIVFQLSSSSELLAEITLNIPPVCSLFAIFLDIWDSMALETLSSSVWFYYVKKERKKEKKRLASMVESEFLKVLKPVVRHDILYCLSLHCFDSVKLFWQLFWQCKCLKISKLI